MDRFFEGLPQNVLTAFRVGDEPVDRRTRLFAPESPLSRKAEITFDD